MWETTKKEFVEAVEELSKLSSFRTINIEKLSEQIGLLRSLADHFPEEKKKEKEL